MLPWCIVLVDSWRRLLADRHWLPFPWTLPLHRRWCPSASHHPVSFLFLPALSFPLYFPFLSLGLSLHRPWCPSASHHSFPFLSFGQLCQRSPWTFPVSFICVESTQRKAIAFAWPGASKRSSHAGSEAPLPNSGFWALGCPLAGSFPRQRRLTTFRLPILALSPPCGKRRGRGGGSLQKIGPNFFRAFGQFQKKIGTFGANWFRPKIFVGTSKTSASPPPPRLKPRRKRKDTGW